MSAAIAHHFTGEVKPLRVLSVHAHACNLVTAQETLIALATPEHGNGPFHVLLDGPAWQGVRQGQHLRLRDGVLHLPTGAIDLAAAHRWDARPTWPRPGPARVAAATAATAELDALARYDPFPLALDPAAEEFGSALGGALARRAASAADALARGLAEADACRLQAGAIALAGLGPGLTPAGDDYLVGFVAGVFTWLADRQPPRTPCGVGALIAEAAAPRTTKLSATWLRCAGHGQFGVVWHRLAFAANSGDEDLLLRAVGEIAATGATSGRAALAGYVDAASALDGIG